MTLRFLLLALGAGLLLGGCLPGEEDVAARYNAINQRAAIENTGVSLSQAANELAAYRVAIALKRKSPLELKYGKAGALTQISTVSDAVKPAAPEGVAVRNCGKFGAIAYFTAAPAGIRNLAASGATMAAALRQQFGADSVGLATGSAVQVPPAASALQQPGFSCGVGSNIAVGSPIFVAGFALADVNDDLPDPNKSTWPSVTRDITVACPGGMSGVVKRKQNCSLVLNDDETEKEKATFELGNADAENEMVENKAQRLRRFWRCTPALGATPSPPTPAEVARYCRDPANDLTKPPDDPIELSVDSLKKILETGSGNYTFKCKRKRDGSNNCEAAPYEGPAATDPRVPDDAKLRCDKITVPPLFVTNPTLPIQLNGSLEIIGDPAATLDCGRGWSGALTARYQVRRCQVVRTVNGVDEPLDIRQTIWHIGYVAAQCVTEFNYRVQCPVGNRGNTLPITRRLEMLKPVALDWSPPIAGVQDWSRSEVATNDSRQEVKDTAAAKGFVVPNVSKAEMDARNDPIEWSLKLAEGMQSRDPSSIRNTVTNCNDAGDPCGTPMTPIITVAYDNTASQPLKNLGANEQVFDDLQCAGSGTCHPLLGGTQATCKNGEAGACRFGSQIIVSPNEVQPPPGVAPYQGFYRLLLNYNEKILQHNNPRPIEFRAFAGPTNLFNDPNAVCNLATLVSDRTVIFGSVANGFNGQIPDFYCPFTAQTYSNINPLITDVMNYVKARGKVMQIYIMGADAFNLPPGVGRINDSLISNAANAEVSGLIAQWLVEPVQPYNVCQSIQ